MASQPTPPNILPARNEAQQKGVINHWFPFVRTPAPTFLTKVWPHRTLLSEGGYVGKGGGSGGPVIWKNDITLRIQTLPDRVGLMVEKSHP